MQRKVSHMVLGELTALNDRVYWEQYYEKQFLEHLALILKALDKTQVEIPSNILVSTTDRVVIDSNYETGSILVRLENHFELMPKEGD